MNTIYKLPSGETFTERQLANDYKTMHPGGEIPFEIWLKNNHLIPIEEAGLCYELRVKLHEAEAELSRVRAELITERAKHAKQKAQNESHILFLANYIDGIIEPLNKLAKYTQEQNITEELINHIQTLRNEK